MPTITTTGFAIDAAATGSGSTCAIDTLDTIAVAGLPDDLLAREFSNIFTFCPGFEAATVKRDPDTSQIIGFAKFSSTQEASEACKVLCKKQMTPDGPLKAELTKQSLASNVRPLSANPLSASRQAQHEHGSFFSSSYRRNDLAPTSPFSPNSASSFPSATSPSAAFSNSFFPMSSPFPAPVPQQQSSASSSVFGSESLLMTGSSPQLLPRDLLINSSEYAGFKEPALASPSHRLKFSSLAIDVNGRNEILASDRAAGSPSSEASRNMIPEAAPKDASVASSASSTGSALSSSAAANAATVEQQLKSPVDASASFEMSIGAREAASASSRSSLLTSAVNEKHSSVFAGLFSSPPQQQQQQHHQQHQQQQQHQHVHYPEAALAPVPASASRYMENTLLGGYRPASGSSAISALGGGLAALSISPSAVGTSGSRSAQPQSAPMSGPFDYSMAPGASNPVHAGSNGSSTSSSEKGGFTSAGKQGLYEADGKGNGAMAASVSSSASQADSLSRTPPSATLTPPITPVNSQFRHASKVLPGPPGYAAATTGSSAGKVKPEASSSSSSIQHQKASSSGNSNTLASMSSGVIVNSASRKASSQSDSVGAGAAVSGGKNNSLPPHLTFPATGSAATQEEYYQQLQQHLQQKHSSNHHSSNSGTGMTSSGNVQARDQNPPCNTLYVGNLPSSTNPEELEALFSNTRGYKRLCFRMRSNGPMCFVEFEDVMCASIAMQELYGHSLSTHTKGGGIRLSFSKNPLGVRLNSNGTATTSKHF
ncbi:MAG: hypothetical protein SGCHY_003758 [Lobulomycetales sp.]